MKTTKRLSIFILVALMLITAFPMTSYAATRCTNNNNHSEPGGNTGKWFNSFDDVEAYVKGIQASWEKKYKNGEITEYEYKKNCPTGYSSTGCAYCGKCSCNFDYNAMWIKSGSRWWYRYTDGFYTKNDWAKIERKWYHFDNSGWMQTGWQQIDNKKYYFASSGVMLTGWQEINGRWYYFDSAGAMRRNKWVGKYYVDGDGRMEETIKYKPSWVKSGNRWWFRHADGSYPKNNWEYIDGWYHFDSSGWMQKGWQKISGKWYYFSSSGLMLTGWQKIGGAWYYMNSSGAMLSNQWIGEYYVNASGKWTKSDYHTISCGNMGKWFNSESELDAYWGEVARRWAHKEETGEITWEEYAKKCPYGYQGYSCNHCGKFTGNFYYD